MYCSSVSAGTNCESNVAVLDRAVFSYNAGAHHLIQAAIDQSPKRSTPSLLKMTTMLEASQEVRTAH